MKDLIRKILREEIEKNKNMESKQKKNLEIENK